MSVAAEGGHGESAGQSARPEEQETIAVFREGGGHEPPVG